MTIRIELKTFCQVLQKTLYIGALSTFMRSAQGTNEFSKGDSQ